jgi:predicted DNA-binding protein
MKMRRTNYYYPIPMLERLKLASSRLGIPVSEVIRRAIEDALQKMKI